MFVCMHTHTHIHYITLHYIALHCIALHCIALHCITLHYITLHLHYITLHYITLHTGTCTLTSTFPSHGLIARLGERVNTYMYIIPLTILHIRLLHYLSELALEICPHGVVVLNASLESKTGQCVRVYAITDSP